MMSFWQELNFNRKIRPSSCLLLMLFSILLCVEAHGQFKQIRGFVTDEKGTPLANVKITNKRDYPLGESNNQGKFVFNYQVPMGGAAPTFYFTKKGYDTYYWEYDQTDNKHIVISEIKPIEYIAVKGTVTDETGNPLSRVKIYSRSHNIKDNYSTTYSNIKGEFSFSYPKLEKPIKIKFQKYGYNSYFWMYEGKQNLHIKLQKIESD